MKIIKTITIFISGVFCFNHDVHSFLGKQTNDYLEMYEPKVLKNIREITDEDFGEMSLWADKIKKNKKWNWAKKHHYININECSNKIVAS
jgi:hypothetical protein